MNLGTIRTSVRKRVGNPTVGDVPDATLDDVINRSYRQICDRFRFYTTRKLCAFDTVLDQQKYNLPTSSLVVLAVSDTTNKNTLIARDESWANDNIIDATTHGKPTSYVHIKDWMQLYPIPDDTYSIKVYYRYSVADLAVDADEPLIPLEWHEGICLLARAVYYDDNQDIPKAQYTFTAYSAWLSTKPNEMDEEMKISDEQGVRVPTKASSGRRLDFDQAD
ncbi:hypothetical protein UFOVP1537_46 [uncultured Caudovirales phage]|uniref:Uncharacterized protein n=2 Tax=root TaxID=1 RepID=A0A6J5QQX4_9CAUD|nr:hypothetical protein UFOVP825_11 [uncultured Caudovirales phage]CAB4171327.1 hypothetical protein UFOVP915_46 [uncultured Caudovirales phage]CAB4177193.1 hypothetical protein UFOVP1000_10 [uncultured Caudovirales phage]CAB4183135.1 hypothetical protein UFOVP1092_38 [uncultured Caudovirales phage]CAB4199045.1 hypothetical protein UFOVP1337_13 [uncultured Caudovirales phage]